MKKTITKFPITSLITLSIFVGFLWRFEVEYYGWAGLIWLSYFHLSIPIGFTLFLSWANFLLNIDWRKRLLINTLGILYGLLVYYGLDVSLNYFFTRRLFDYSLQLHIPQWQLNFMRYSLFFIVPFIPLGAYLILKLVKSHPPLKFLMFSILGIIASIPFSVLLLEIMDHKGGQDVIHSIKSGVLIPFWFFSIGLLSIGIKKVSSSKSSM